MSLRSFSRLSAALLLLAACEDGPTQPVEQDLAPELALDQLAAEANSAGDADAADAFSAGAYAVRLGLQPTEIAVQIAGETIRYYALVAGFVRTLPNDERVLARTLVAWTPDRRPEAVLQVSLLTDAGSFGFPARLSTDVDPRGRARGTWADLVRQIRWVATEGSATISLEGTGAPCTHPGPAALSCLTARYDVRVDGVFHVLLRRDGVATDLSRRLEIATSASGVAGVVIGQLD